VALDKLGFTVYAGVRKESDAKKLTLECPSLKPIILDVSDDGSVKKAAERVESDLKASGETLVGVVNNAGICIG